MATDSDAKSCKASCEFDWLIEQTAMLALPISRQA